MNKKKRTVDGYIAKSATFAKPILIHIRKLVHEACPDVTETIKWNFPHFDYKGMMCSMAAFKEHCSFGFWKASLMKGAEKLTAIGETGMGHFGKITNLKDLPSDKVILSYIREACKLNEEGVKVDRPRRETPKKITIPPDLKAALKKNRKADKVFEDFSYSKRKDYADWIIEAKTEATREKRLTTAVEWMAQGKSRNWKYER